MPGFDRSPFDDFMDEQCVLNDGKSFYARIAGAAHLNSDGSSRQMAIAELRPMDELVLEHEPDNIYDPNAIRVLTADRRQIGYLDQRLASETVRRSKRGVITRAFVSNVTGSRGGSIRGCTLGILTYNQTYNHHEVYDSTN